jgi:hypothetical protein
MSKVTKVCHGLVETKAERDASEKEFREWIREQARTTAMVTKDPLKVKIDGGDVDE